MQTGFLSAKDSDRLVISLSLPLFSLYPDFLSPAPSKREFNACPLHSSYHLVVSFSLLGVSISAIFQSLLPPASPENPSSSLLTGPMKGVAASRRRPQRKDRHSKIFTARGPRDRRMRLSLEVARKFFDLQDMLGFDKASKTVDWLLTNATNSIKELATCSSPADAGGSGGGGKSESSTSECEVISADAVPPKNLKKGALSRESRDLARARARERTRKKVLAEGNGQTSENLASGQIPAVDFDGNIAGGAMSLAQEQWNIQPTVNAEEQRVLFHDAQLISWFWDPFANPPI